MHQMNLKQKEFLMKAEISPALMLPYTQPFEEDIELFTRYLSLSLFNTTQSMPKSWLTGIYPSK